jgi:hypothetical protein
MKIYALAEKLPAIMEQRERLQANSSAALAELDARREAAEAERVLEEAKTRKAAVELVATRVTAKLPFLKESDKFALDSVKEKIADTNFDALDPTTKAYNAYAGHLVPQLAKAYVTVMKEIESLTDELDKYKKAKPSVKSGSNSVGSTSDSSVDFATAIERAFAGA